MENAEQFGAESRFSKLQNKVAKQYEEDGYTKEEAMKIGGAVAYDSGVKKYGKQGMKNLTTKGIKKAQKRRARKSNSKARTMARKGARRSKALAYGAESYSADFGKPTDGDFTTMQVRIGSSSGSTTSWTTSFNIQCVGDEDNLSYLTSDIEDVVVDRVKRWNGDQFGDFIPMQIVIGSSSGNSGSWYRAFTVKPVGGEDNLSYLASDIEDVVVDRVKSWNGAEGAYSYSRSAESRAADTMSWENSAPYATLKGYNPVDSVQEYPPLGYGVTQNFGSEHEQGYDDREDESLGMSDDESGMEQDYQDRRDESAGMERHRGRRKYARVGTMDEHDRFNTEYESPYGTRQTTDFGLVGMGNDFAQNRAEQFEAKSGKRTRIGNRYVTRNKRGQIKTNVNVGRSLTADRRQRAKNHADPGYGHQGDNLRAETFAAEDGNQFMTGARYGAGAVIGITGATLILGSIMSIFIRK